MHRRDAGCRENAGITRATTGPSAFGPSPGLREADADRSVEVWVNPTSTTNYETLVEYGNFRITYRNNTREVELRQSGSRIAVWGITQPIAGSWHHLVMTTNGTNATLWVDGVNEGARPVALNTTTTTGIRIGNRGSFDEVAIYPTALTQTQIAAHYAAVP